MSFLFYRQLNEKDCGPTCLRMLAQYYGKTVDIEVIRQATEFTKQGVSLFNIGVTAEKLGFNTKAVRLSFEELQMAPLPAIIHWNQNHFVVLLKLKKKSAVIADPARGILKLSREEFLQSWLYLSPNLTVDSGIGLLLQPSYGFEEDSIEQTAKSKWTKLYKYLVPHKWGMIQITISLLLLICFQLMIPYLTQSMVDNGINTRNLNYISILLIAQLILTISSSVVSFIKARLQLTISNRISFALLSDFWIKLTRLPLTFFEKRQTGDILQRINDNRSIQTFLTSETLQSVFSIFTLIIYSLILLNYNGTLFLIFVCGNILYFFWIFLFLRIRRKLNFQTFHLSTQENNATIEMIMGMQDLRLSNAEGIRRSVWENIAFRMMKLNFKSLNYSQWQTAGGLLISQSKDILISFSVASLVIENKLTFGALIAIQFIIGQLNGPVQQLIGLSQSMQDFNISLERLNEVHQLEDEESDINKYQTYLPASKTILLTDVSFSYPTSNGHFSIKNFNLIIPEGKITAIVGGSGSGKTTLLKVLLKIYDLKSGNIKVGQSNLSDISPSFWRGECGVVLQDGYIFDDSVARNVALGDSVIDYERVQHSLQIANLEQFVSELPQGINTKIGSKGIGLSQGQKQRILIARAVYKNPSYLLLDEATNSLDAESEKVIVENLTSFFVGRTVIIVAHRLSTVKHADNIVVIENGELIEEGSHSYLTSLKGKYYNLVRNQLELGI
jgi:ATP-binding cassette subfamily B protein